MDDKHLPLQPAPDGTQTGGRLPTQPPLPLRQGVAASRVYLPQGPWRSVGEFLQHRFPRMDASVLHRRLTQGDIVDAHGAAQQADSPYRACSWLWYYREVTHEVTVPFDLPILFQDERLVVVDKPHFLASIPGGRHLHETALTRLRERLDNPLVTPIHRLDLETAGVLMFCLDPEARGAYQSLFQERLVSKTYEAIAPIDAQLALPMVYRSRISAETGQFVVTTDAQALPNSETRIELIGQAGPDWGRYCLRPLTGRKHQLRAHMSALGIPIMNDRLYPKIRAFREDDDFSRPLQLLARSIAFTDPLSGVRHQFESQRQLCFDPVM